MVDEAPSPSGAGQSQAVLRILAVLAAVAVAAVVFFDFGPPLAFNDDWVYSWSVKQLSTGHGFRVPSEQLAAAVFHVLWGTAVTLGHPDQRLLRLTILPLAAMGAFSTYQISRRLGADAAWGLIAALAVAANPISLMLTSTFMTDAAYIGLLMTAAWLALRWWQDGKGIALCILLTVLAAMERQVGVGVAVALSGALVVFPRRAMTRRDWAGLAALWLLVASALLVPLAVIGTTTQTSVIREFGKYDLLGALVTLIYLPQTVGLVLLPLVFAVRPRLKLDSIAQLVAGAVLLALCGLILLYLSRRYPGRIFAGPDFTSRGIGPNHLSGQKQVLFPAVLFVPLELLALLGGVMVLSWHRTLARSRRLLAPALFLGCVGAAQLVPLVHVGILDRYFLPVLAPLAPVGAALATATGGRLARNWAVAVIAVFIATYVAGEQDYQAWQQARDTAARRAYTMAPAERVAAGYEADGVYLYLPLQDTDPKSPLLPHWTPQGADISEPPNPCIVLSFAGPADPRPGVSYASLAPGRVVLILRRQPCLN